MKANEAKLRALAWWEFREGHPILVRVCLVGRENATVRILAATAEQVILSGYGIGEAVTVPFTSLRDVD
jgi:hypothetical protein